MYEVHKAVPRFISVTGDTTLARTDKSIFWTEYSENAYGEMVEKVVDLDSDPRSFFYDEETSVVSTSDFEVPLCGRETDATPTSYPECIVDTSDLTILFGPISFCIYDISFLARRLQLDTNSVKFSGGQCVSMIVELCDGECAYDGLG